MLIISLLLKVNSWAHYYLLEFGEIRKKTSLTRFWWIRYKRVRSWKLIKKIVFK